MSAANQLPFLMTAAAFLGWGTPTAPTDGSWSTVSRGRWRRRAHLAGAAPRLSGSASALERIHPEWNRRLFRNGLEV